MVLSTFPQVTHQSLHSVTSNVNQSRLRKLARLVRQKRPLLCVIDPRRMSVRSPPVSNCLKSQRKNTQPHACLFKFPRPGTAAKQPLKEGKCTIMNPTASHDFPATCPMSQNMRPAGTGKCIGTHNSGLSRERMMSCIDNIA